MSIFNFVPSSYTLRDVQRGVLQEIEDNWNEYDVFVVDAPVAAGKSLISIIVSNWRNSVNETTAVLTPRALLQDQYQRDFPQIPSLKGKGKYVCKTQGYKTCADFYDVADRYCCGECPYKNAVETAVEAPQVILNFHSHLFGGMVHDMYKDVLIIDEAHNLVPMLSDVYTLQIWSHKEKYPYETHTKDDIIIWLSAEIERLIKSTRQSRAIYKNSKMPAAAKKTLITDTRKLMKYQMIKSGLQVPQELFNISKDNKAYGRGRRRLECIEVKPISLKTVPHQMWPDGEVKKVVMMSATIYDKDIERLGIKRKRVKYIKCDSPIPAANRPIIMDAVAPMSFKNIKESTRLVSDKIKKLADFHTGKGVIHITYGLIAHFQKYLKGDRYMWHTDKDREEVYAEFLASEESPILMACGMGEGIDLVGQQYEWQVIAKAMFPSLADPLQKHFTEKDPLVYSLETARATVQQTGRICRTPTDYGITYILDSSFASFYKRSTGLRGEKWTPNYELFPDYFQEGLIWAPIKTKK